MQLVLWGDNRDNGDGKINRKILLCNPLKASIWSPTDEVMPEVTQHISFCKSSKVDVNALLLCNSECFPVRFHQALVIICYSSQVRQL